jgi:hypothetical protein
MKTPVALLLVHCVAFLMLLAGKLAPGDVGNAVVAVGLCVEFPGWRLGLALTRSTGAMLAVAFVFNAVLYWSGGMVIDRATRARAA